MAAQQESWADMGAKGLFITFEGGEGTGKSTQIALLADHLRQQGHAVLTTREPGGTKSAEAIRKLLVTGETGSLSSTAEALLNYAARDDHLRRIIRPALARGEIVLCDRFMDSTRAYQAYAGDCPAALVDTLEREVVDGTRPHLTLIFDLPVETGLQRAATRGDGKGEDRFERFGRDFHDRLRQAWQRIAREDPQRCKLVDATGSIGEVAGRVRALVQPLLKGRRP